MLWRDICGKGRRRKESERDVGIGREGRERQDT